MSAQRLSQHIANHPISSRFVLSLGTGRLRPYDMCITVAFRHLYQAFSALHSARSICNTQGCPLQRTPSSNQRTFLSIGSLQMAAANGQTMACVLMATAAHPNQRMPSLGMGVGEKRDP